MSEKGLVLVAEDDHSIAEVLRLYLSREGYGVTVVTSGDAALAAARSQHPVALVLDIGLPGMDGTEVCRRLRAEGNWLPVLFCTARDDEIDRIIGLELGGDDYITKPFSPREVVARVKSQVRRANVREVTRVYNYGSLSVDAEARTVSVADTPIELTATEFDLLEHLLARPGRVISRDQLLAEVWGYAAAVGTRTVDVHVAQVRSKLGEASPIRTVRGVGYSVAAESE